MHRMFPKFSTAVKFEVSKSTDRRSAVARKYIEIVHSTCRKHLRECICGASPPRVHTAVDERFAIGDALECSFEVSGLPQRHGPSVQPGEWLYILHDSGVPVYFLALFYACCGGRWRIGTKKSPSHTSYSSGLCSLMLVNSSKMNGCSMFWPEQGWHVIESRNLVTCKRTPYSTGQGARCRQIRDTPYRSCTSHMQAASAGSGAAIAMWVISVCFVQVCGVSSVSGEPRNGGRRANSPNCSCASPPHSG